ncbi:hypothetical protein SPHINGOR109_20041 [Sphingorhabdus sp. 109]|nr:hypothetical protein SPHINGOR109_20041 [Sphingorhabdus sp. 109]
MPDQFLFPDQFPVVAYKYPQNGESLGLYQEFLPPTEQLEPFGIKLKMQETIFHVIASIFILHARIQTLSRFDGLKFPPAQAMLQLVTPIMWGRLASPDCHCP